jgi:hypothetical protein
MRFDIETQASPDEVHRALTDFTHKRLHIWNRTLDPKTYELREHGPNWAVARESTPWSPFWVVARYDWIDPSMVRWTVVESSYGGGGQGFVRSIPPLSCDSAVSCDNDHAVRRSSAHLRPLQRRWERATAPILLPHHTCA